MPQAYYSQQTLACFFQKIVMNFFLIIVSIMSSEPFLYDLYDSFNLALTTFIYLKDNGFSKQQYVKLVSQVGFFMSPGVLYCILLLPGQVFFC